MPICSKFIFWRSLIKFSTEFAFKFNDRFLKQLDGCITERPLSLTISGVYMFKMGNDIVIPSNSILLL